MQASSDVVAGFVRSAVPDHPADPLPIRRIGTNGPEVSVIGFGGAPIGNLGQEVDDTAAQIAVESAWREGIRHFDTAPHYGLGLSERRLGAALADCPRQDFVLSTKVGRLLAVNPAPIGSDLNRGGFAVPDKLTRIRDYSHDGIMRSIESSLDRLGLDSIDIVYVHDPDDHLEEAIDQAIPALATLRDQGVIKSVGAGMNFVDPLRRIVAQTDVDVVMVAGRYTLVDRRAGVLLDDCVERSVSVVVAAPFNSGLLARPWPRDGAHFDYAPAPPEILRLARKYASICREFSVALPQAALQFPLRHPAVVAVMTGMRTADQARECAAWSRMQLPEELWSALSDWPIPREYNLTG